MPRTIDDLREMLFQTLEGLKNGELEIEKAKAIGDISQTIINSAKVEVDYIRVCGDDARPARNGSKFLGNQHPFLIGHKAQ